MNIKYFRILSIFLLVMGTAASNTTLAQEIQVNSADPATATQGTYNLDVEIGGKGFDNTIDVVEFLLPCSEEPCSDTGGITVKSFKVRGQKKIIANIDISDAAVVTDFDIVVRSTSRGRGGKGTTLFKVQSKDTAGGTGSTLAAEFCLIMTVENPGLQSDGDMFEGTVYDYCHDRKERVQVETGSHPGFRFDSNTKSRPPLRKVYINVPGGSVSIDLNTFTSGFYQIDLRFDRDNGGLDLGGMLLDSATETDYFVPVNIWLDSLDGLNNRFGLAYSTDTNPLSTGILNNNTCVGTYTRDAQVKLIEDGRWSIESTPDSLDLDSPHTACLWDLNANLENQSGTPVNMPFYIEIFIK